MSPLERSDLAEAAQVRARATHGANADAIVVAFRSASVLSDCIQALRRDIAVDKIIVVNNSPGDGLQAVAEQHSRVVYLEPPRNIGFGSAVNLAMREVGHDFVVLANPDAIAEGGTVSELVAFLSGRPNAAIAAPRMRSPTGRLYRNSHHRVSLLRMGFQALGWPEALQIPRTRRTHLEAHRTDYVIGSFVLCRVSSCASVGWFDESIFLFGEDQDLCRRIRGAGWEVWYAGVGNVTHASGHSWRQMPEVAREQFRQARYRELRADAGRLQAYVYKAAVAVPAGIRRMRRS